MYRVIEEYEKTLDSRFGGGGVQLNSLDTALMVGLVYRAREEMVSRTGLR